AAQVQAGAERAERLQLQTHGVEDPLRRPEGGVIELRCQQVVAALGGRQRLLRQLQERRTIWVEHHPFASAASACDFLPPPILSDHCHARPALLDSPGGYAIMNKLLPDLAFPYPANR